jgi:hypothetical protein
MLLAMDTTDERDAMRRWAENWRRVGPILEQIRHEELRRMTEAEAAESIGMLSEFALSCPNQETRTTSGFVEQQRLFMKLLKDGSSI